LAVLLIARLRPLMAKWAYYLNFAFFACERTARLPLPRAVEIVIPPRRGCKKKFGQFCVIQRGGPTRSAVEDPRLLTAPAPSRGVYAWNFMS